MTTRTLAYDHPLHLVRDVYSGSTTVGANGVTTKWSAFTAIKLMAVVQSIAIASTAAGSQPLLYSKSGTATTTTTLSALTSAAITPLYNAISITLAQGDIFWYTHGTDATAQVSVAIESQVVAQTVVTI